MICLISRRLNAGLLRQLCLFERSSDHILRHNIGICNAISYSTKKGQNHQPNLFEKYLLVWMKKYPSVSKVPDTISYDTMEKTRNWARIKINIVMCVLTAVGCIFMIYSGKQAAKKGETISKMAQKWHDEQNAKAN